MTKHLDYLSGVSQEMIHSILHEKDRLIHRYAEENAKLRDVVEASKWLLHHVNRDYAEWKEPLEKALAALETTNG